MMKTWLYGAVILTICVKLSFTQKMFPNNSTVISIKNGFDIGLWGRTEFCPYGMYAAGFEQKIEPFKYRPRDNSALNGIKLLCRTETSGGSCSENSITSSEGRDGDWNGHLFCPDGSYLIKFELQMQQYSNAPDKTAAEFISFQCQDKNDNKKVQDLIQHPGYWKRYLRRVEPSGTCPPGTRICGIKTKVQYVYDSGTDNTGLGDVIMFCCIWGTDF